MKAKEGRRAGGKKLPPQKIPDNGTNKRFKRPRAPFNYSTGIQQFPVLSPRGIALDVHRGFLRENRKRPAAFSLEPIGMIGTGEERRVFLATIESRIEASRKVVFPAI